MKPVDVGNKRVNNRHKPTFNSLSINHAIERAIKDEKLLISALKSIESMKFPAYKNDIIHYLKYKTNDEDTISLFESLDGYIQYNDLYHIRKSIEQNIPEKKLENQIHNHK